MTMEELAWWLLGGACVLLLAGVNILLRLIIGKLSWVDQFTRKCRSEEAAAINELQGRCSAHHPGSPPIRHELSTD